MHTTDQATGLWCPMARYTERNGDAAYNRCSAGATGKCIVSDCAMWRWEPMPARQVVIDRTPTSEDGVVPRRPAHVPETWHFSEPEDDAACWVESEAEWLARRTGYCGLAGKPT